MAQADRITWSCLVYTYVSRFYKKAAAFVLRAVAKHSPDLAQAVVDSGALDALVPCLEVRFPVRSTITLAIFATRHGDDHLMMQCFLKRRGTTYRSGIRSPPALETNFASVRCSACFPTHFSDRSSTLR